MKIITTRKTPFDQYVTFADGRNTLTFDITLIADVTYSNWFVTDEPFTSQQFVNDEIDHLPDGYENMVIVSAAPVVTSEAGGEDTVLSMARFTLDDGGVKRYLTLVNGRPTSEAGNKWEYTTPAGTQAMRP